MVKRLFSLLVAVVMLATLFAISASAETTGTFVVEADNVKAGQDVVVKVSATIPTAGFNVLLTYPADKLAYKSYEKSESNITVEDDGAGNIIIGYTNLAGMDLNCELASIIFTAYDEEAMGDTTVVDAEIGITYGITKKGAVDIYRKDANNYTAEELSFEGKTIVISKTHLAPEVTAIIVGKPIVGRTLTASATYTDNWNLDGTITYEWFIDGESVATGETYVVKEEDIEKTVTLKATVTVDAEENAIGVGEISDVCRDCAGKFRIDTQDYVLSGNDIALKVTSKIPTAGFNVWVTYPSDKLVYKSAETMDSNTSVTDNGEGKITISYINLSGADIDSELATIIFTACDEDALGEEIVDAEFEIMYGKTKKGGIDVYNKEGISYTEDELSFVGKDITVRKAHRAPTVTTVISGDAIVGRTLTANATYTDNWNLEGETTYAWFIGDEKVAEGETYVVKAGDYGKTIKANATTVVDAEENATGVGEAMTDAVIYDASAKSSATVEIVSTLIAVGVPVKIETTTTKSINEGEVMLTYAWTCEDGTPLAGSPVNEETYIPVLADYEAGKKIKVTVTPRGANDTVDGDAVSAVTFSDIVKISVDPEDVEVANFEGDVYSDAYGVEDANIIEISKGNLDPSVQGVKVGGSVFFYSPVRGKYVGIVSGYDDSETLVADIELTDTPPVNVYYGTVDDPTHEYWEEGDGVTLADVMVALRMMNGYTEGLGMEAFISADVDQDGEILLSDVMMILQAKNGLREKFDIENN